MRREISEAKPMEAKMHIGLDDVVKQSFERLQKGAIEKPEEKLDAATEKSFAELEKESVFDEDSGECMVSIKYDEQNENEIIIRLLSFGPVVEVLSPYDFRRKIKERVDRQLALIKE